MLNLGKQIMSRVCAFPAHDVADSLFLYSRQRSRAPRSEMSETLQKCPILGRKARLEEEGIFLLHSIGKGVKK